MRLLAPIALCWLLLAAPIIFFYLLKLKRKRQTVPSVLLWQRALEETRASTPFRKLRRNLLLILQLLILLAIAAALARPAMTTTRIASGNTAVVIDSTASMTTRDESGGVSRLERAKQVAAGIIDSTGEGDRVAIIEASNRAIVRCPLTSDHRALASALDQVVETDAAGG